MNSLCSFFQSIIKSLNLCFFPKVVKLLLQHGSDPVITNERQTRRETALDLAAQYGRYSVSPVHLNSSSLVLFCVLIIIS